MAGVGEAGEAGERVGRNAECKVQNAKCKVGEGAGTGAQCRMQSAKCKRQNGEGTEGEVMSEE
jgi:hypothetical protein